MVSLSRPRSSRISAPSLPTSSWFRPARRLVEQQQPGLRGERARELHALLRAEGKFRDGLRCEGFEAKQGKHRARLSAARPRRAQHAAGAARWRGTRRASGSGNRP